MIFSPIRESVFQQKEILLLHICFISLKFRRLMKKLNLKDDIILNVSGLHPPDQRSLRTNSIFLFTWSIGWNLFCILKARVQGVQWNFKVFFPRFFVINQRRKNVCRQRDRLRPQGFNSWCRVWFPWSENGHLF